jgi:hypothetical protein
MGRLFKAWSILKDQDDDNEARIYWFVVGREEPVIPYEQLIDDYDPDYSETQFDELYVNEFFTKEELEKLKDYLYREHQLETFAEEVLLPVKAGGRSYGLLLISGIKGFYMLADEESYDLDISVLGHSEMLKENITKKPTISKEALTNGTNFLKMVFNKLEIEHPGDKDLSSVITSIYEEFGFYVKNG